MEKEMLYKKDLLLFKPVESICFISKGKLINIPMTEITHISKVADDTIIYTARASFVTYHSLQELANELPVNDFFRVHHKHIINRVAVSSVSVNTVRVNGCTIPVTDHYKQQLKNEWNDLMKACSNI